MAIVKLEHYCHATRQLTKVNRADLAKKASPAYSIKKLSHLKKLPLFQQHLLTIQNIKTARGVINPAT